jgi:hypothetical protein
MRRTLATAGTVLLVSLALTGCGDNAGGAKAGAKSGSSASPAAPDLPTGVASCLPTGILSDLPTEIPSDLPTEIPSDLASCLPSGIPSDLPTGIPSDLPTEIPSGLPTDVPSDEPTVVPSPASGALDACAVVTPALVTGDLGAASAGQGLPQASSYGDPNAKDCYYFGGDATVVVQATTRADADMPASTNTYEGVPGAEQVPGADRGWVFAASAQNSTTAGVILVNGQHGINCSIITQGRTITVDDLQDFAEHALASL